MQLIRGENDVRKKGLSSIIKDVTNKIKRGFTCQRYSSMYLNTGFSSKRFMKEIKERIKDRGMRQKELASVLQRSRKHLNKLLNNCRYAQFSH